MTSAVVDFGESAEPLVHILQAHVALRISIRGSRVIRMYLGAKLWQLLLLFSFIGLVHETFAASIRLIQPPPTDNFASHARLQIGEARILNADSVDTDTNRRSRSGTEDIPEYSPD